MRLLKQVIGKEKMLFIVLIMMGAIAGGLYTWTIKLIHSFLSEGMTISLFIQIVGFATSSAIVAVYSGRRMTKLYERNISDLRIELSRKVMNASFERIEGKSKVIVPVLMNEVHSLTNFVKSLPASVVAFFQFLGILIYMLWLSYPLAIIMLLIFGLLFAFNFSFLSRLYRVGREASSVNHKLHSSIEGLVKGMKELVINRKHNQVYIDSVIEPKSQAFADKQSEISSINITSSKFSEWLVIISLSSIVFIAQGETIPDTELLIKFVTLLLFVLPSLITVTTFFRSLKKMQVSIDKIEELGISFTEDAQNAYHQQSNSYTAKSKGTPLISLRDATYDYSGGTGQFRIGPVSLDIHQNEVLCITGGNGSGKTTLMKILVGLYTPKSGTLLNNGHEVEPQTLSSYREQFSVSFTDSFVFQDLTYLNDSELANDSQYLINLLELQDKISIQNLRISDVDLSFGQRGRLNLLRTILEDKAIIVFDEWAANQDPYFKAKFYKEVIPFLKQRGKTIVMISHDDTYYNVADRFVHLSEGKIIDRQISFFTQ